jgi:endonuclease/exonuclease/phosphatase (EEP) superfamily protein YafD
VGSVVVVVVAFVLRRRGAAALAALAAVVLAIAVAPRALGGPSAPEGDAGPTLRVLTANMHFGGGSATDLVALVRSTHADVLAVEELTPDLVRRLNAAGIGELMPRFVLESQNGGGGTGLYSRLPLTQTVSPLGTLSKMAAARVRVRGAGEVDVLAVHTAPPTRGRMPVWADNLRALPDATPDGPLRILPGDFNATLDHAELRRLLDTGYDDAAAVVGKGLKATWPAHRRIPPPVTIDHVLVDNRIGVRALSVHPIDNTDHRAVFAELTLPRD